MVGSVGGCYVWPAAGLFVLLLLVWSSHDTVHQGERAVVLHDGAVAGES